MACCFWRRRRWRDNSEHDVYLYPATAGGELLVQYGGELRPELVYGAGPAHSSPTPRTATASVSRAELDRVAPEYTVGQHWRRSRTHSRASTGSLNGTGATDDAECAICLDAVSKGDRARAMPECGHNFHGKCIVDWLKGSNLCPSCMQPVVAASSTDGAATTTAGTTTTTATTSSGITTTSTTATVAASDIVHALPLPRIRPMSRALPLPLPLRLPRQVEDEY